MFSMLIILIYWVQLLLSSAYIETGIYLKDIGRDSYPTGVTFRLFCMIELYFLVFFILARKRPVRWRTEELPVSYGKYTKTLWLMLLISTYRLLDILISGNTLTDSAIDRFNFYSDYSTLPLANVAYYFSYPFMWLAGYILTTARKKRQMIFPIVLYVEQLLCLVLIGIQFGGFLQSTVYFITPTLLKLAKKRKLIRIRYAAIALVAVVAMLLPKYEYFEERLETGKADTSYGLNTAMDFLLYRALGQEADLTWEIDRQIVENGETDPGRFFEQIQEILGLPVDNTTYYLMERGLSSSTFNIYMRGNAVVTGGYPISWAAMFGYLFAIPFWILDAVCLFMIARIICEGIAKRRLFLLLSGSYLLCQAYTIVINANFAIMSNTIPRLLIIMLLFLYKKPLRIKMKGKSFRI